MNEFVAEYISYGVIFLICKKGLEGGGKLVVVRDFGYRGTEGSGHHLGEILFMIFYLIARCHEQ